MDLGKQAVSWHQFLLLHCFVKHRLDIGLAIQVDCLLYLPFFLDLLRFFISPYQLQCLFGLEAVFIVDFIGMVILRLACASSRLLSKHRLA